MFVSPSVRLYFTYHLFQVYIVAGACCRTFAQTTSTEKFLKDTGTEWQIAADLPSSRYNHIGVGLDNGKFLVSG